MLDKVLMDDRCRWVPSARHISALLPAGLLQASQAWDHLATHNSGNFVAPGSGLSTLWEAVCHQTLSTWCTCLTCSANVGDSISATEYCNMMQTVCRSPFVGLNVYRPSNFGSEIVFKAQGFVGFELLLWPNQTCMLLEPQLFTYRRQRLN